MLETTAEKIGWAIAILIVVVMGVIVFTGPYHHFNKAEASTTTQASSLPPFHIKIITNLKHPQFVGQYSPDPATVHVGQEVIFQNFSNAPHTVTVNGLVDSGTIDIGQTYTRFPTRKAGTYHYRCTFHPGMVGTLIVKA